jgi:hypothetical protein
MFAILESLTPAIIRTSAKVAYGVQHAIAIIGPRIPPTVYQVKQTIQHLDGVILTALDYAVTAGTHAYNLGSEFAQTEQGQAARRYLDAQVKRGLNRAAATLTTLAEKI